MAKILNNQRRLFITNQSEFPDFLKADNNNDIYYFNSGREGLYALITENYQLPGNVLLPAYLPEGIYVPFKKLNWTIYFYELNKDGTSNEESVLNVLNNTSVDVIIMIHLFGIPNTNKILITKLKSQKVLIIEDMAHSLGSELMNKTFGQIGDIVLYSPGKMIGVPTAGILKIKKTSQIRISEGKINMLWFIYNFFSGLFLLFSTWLQKMPVKEANIIMPFYKVAGAISYKILMLNFTSKTRLWSVYRYLIQKTNYSLMVQKRTEMISYYTKNLTKDKFEFFAPVYNNQYTMMGFPVFVKGNREQLMKYLKKHNVYGLSLSGKGWMFLSKKEQQAFPIAMSIHNNHFLFPLNPFHSMDELKKIVNIANNWEI